MLKKNIKNIFLLITISFIGNNFAGAFTARIDPKVATALSNAASKFSSMGTDIAIEAQK